MLGFFIMSFTLRMCAYARHLSRHIDKSCEPRDEFAKDV